MLHPHDTYVGAPYEPLVPAASDPEKMVYKFNSPQHFISWVRGLDNFPRASSQRDSDTHSFNFALSDSLEHAFKVIGEYQFAPKDQKNIEARVSEIKKGTMHAEDGFELDIAQHLSGSDRVWLAPRHKKTPTRIINDVLIIDGAYNAYLDAGR